MQAQSDRTGALTGMIGGITSIAGAGLSSGAFSGSGATSTLGKGVPAGGFASLVG